jgi:hypothetical protein
MRILADSNITAASVTATNVLSATFTEKLKNFQLADKMITLTNDTDIDFTFNGVVPGINMIALCGTNLTPTAVVEVSYSDTDIETPDATISMTVFSTLNQVIFLGSVITKKYWRVSIVDTALTSLFAGYLYCGEYLDIPYVEFGHNAELNMFSNSSISPTGQGFGGKTYNALPVDFTMLLDYDLLNDYLAIKLDKQNVDPVVLIEYIETYDNVLYRPKYGVLTNTEIPYPQNKNTLNYSVQDRLEERF